MKWYASEIQLILQAKQFAMTRNNSKQWNEMKVTTTTTN